MSLHRQRITLRVTSQTAYHIRQTAERLGMTEGEIVDALVRVMQKGGGPQILRSNEPRGNHVKPR